MELLCRCDDIPDEGVELRVLKGLLTAVTSNTLHIHGQALLLVSRLPLAAQLLFVVLPRSKEFVTVRAHSPRSPARLRLLCTPRMS